MTHAGMVVGELNLGVLVILGPDQVTTTGLTSSFCLAAVYAGLYLGQRAVLAHVAMLTVVSVGAARLGSNVPVALSVVTTVVPVSVVLAFITHRLASLLRRESQRDALTGLLNRRGLYARAQMLRAAGGESAWSVAILDLDGFKSVNDRMGHDAGDALLRSASCNWQQFLPRGGLLARTGGDEFVMVVRVELEAQLRIIQQMREASPPEVGLSAGATSWVFDVPLDEALRHADGALYRAKAAGKGMSCTAS